MRSLLKSRFGDADGLSMAAKRGAGTIAVTILAAVLIVAPFEPRVNGLAIAAATVLGTAWAFRGLRRQQLPRSLFRLLIATAATNFVCTLAWIAPAVLGDGAPLAQPSPADVGFVIADLLLAAAIVFALARRERPLNVLLDLITIAAVAALVIGVLLASPVLQRGGIDGALRASGLAYVVADVFLIASVLRVLLAPRGRPRALWLLAGSGAALAATDLLSNDVLLSGTSPMWVGIGWGIAPLLLGLAALDPSLARLGSPDRVNYDLRATSAVVLGLGSLIAPLLLLLHSIDPRLPDIDDSLSLSAVVLAGGSVIASLVVMRFLLLLHRARELTDTATLELDERSRALERSEARYRQLIEKVPAVVILFKLGPHEPIPVYVSPQSNAILGVSAEAWVSDPDAMGARIHPDDLAMLESRLEHGDTQTDNPEFRFLRPDGEEVWVRDVSGVITEDADGRYLQSMLVDITGSKRSEDERQRMEDELRLAHKLEAVGQLAAGIAHEINTPIQFVGDTLHFLQEAFADLLALSEVQRELRQAAEDDAVSPQLLERARDAEEAADLEYLVERAPGAFVRGADGIARVATIVRAMRDYAHPPTSEKTAVDLVSVLHDSLIVATNAYKYVADVETDLVELPDVLCNGGEITQVFLNLVVNAAHAIETEVGDSGRRGLITLRARRDGDHVVISVADTGGGIPADVADRVFDPFFTTKEVGRGTGQGLALARTMIVERHGGTLTFETQPGCGTTFVVRLPIGAVQELVEVP